MLIGYARVSKADGSQLLDLQRDALLDAGVAAERVYEDRASGRKDHRPGLNACLKALQPGNTFVVWKLDRLGRDLKHLVSTVDELRARGVGLRVLAGAGAEIDTTTANGRLGVESGRGRNPTLRIFPMPFDDVGDSVLADAQVACDPAVAPPPVDGMEHLRGEAV